MQTQSTTTQAPDPYAVKWARSRMAGQRGCSTNYEARERMRCSGDPGDAKALAILVENDGVIEAERHALVQAAARAEEKGPGTVQAGDPFPVAPASLPLLDCPECGGQGYVGREEQTNEVTSEMAMDAGDRSMAGQPIFENVRYECQRCGGGGRLERTLEQQEDAADQREAALEHHDGSLEGFL